MVLFDIINTVQVTATVKVYQMLKSCLIFENVNESVRSASSVTLMVCDIFHYARPRLGFQYFQIQIQTSDRIKSKQLLYQNQSCVLLCNVF